MVQTVLFPPDSDWSAPSSFPDLTGEKEIAIDLETCDPWLKTHGPGWAFKDRGHIIGVAVATDGWKGYFPVGHQTGANLDKKVVYRWLQKQLSSDSAKVFHNAQYDLGWLMNEGLTINGTIHDTLFAAPLLNENEYSYSLNNLGKTYLNEQKDESMLTEAAQMFGVDPKSEMYKLPPEYVGQYAEQDADLTYRLWQLLKKGIREDDVQDIYNLESALLPVLLDMRNRGVLIDIDQVQKVKKFFSQ
jgi:DNA polymerase I-like protein with 3'-5' exonuclease and polymerase domains